MLSEHDWQSIQEAIRLAIPQSEITLNEVVSVDVPRRIIFTHEFGSTSIPIVGFKQHVKFYDEVITTSGQEIPQESGPSADRVLTTTLTDLVNTSIIVTVPDQGGTVVCHADFDFQITASDPGTLIGSILVDDVDLQFTGGRFAALDGGPGLSLPFRATVHTMGYKIFASTDVGDHIFKLQARKGNSGGVANCLLNQTRLLITPKWDRVTEVKVKKVVSEIDLPNKGDLAVILKHGGGRDHPKCVGIIQSIGYEEGQ